MDESKQARLKALTDDSGHRGLGQVNLLARSRKATGYGDTAK